MQCKRCGIPMHTGTKFALCANCRAEIAELEAENERLREYPTSLCLHLLWHRRNGPPTCFGCGAILRDGRWVSLAEQAAEAATYYEEEADDD